MNLAKKLRKRADSVLMLAPQFDIHKDKTLCVIKRAADRGYYRTSVFVDPLYLRDVQCWLVEEGLKVTGTVAGDIGLLTIIWE